ncbi:EamA family transporter [Paracidovorax valerianellae]|uniref:EamA-like transporter family protein n=1 Tax=Paracidovorax valerianellae TaxID=187868 RepID=A0A1G7A890_9BURK|nr:EamA family transporter [Paracidovorax valerianellae]MDA8443712.1 DMT family transporter [Paracidovorax valerianellae]SDE11094.1 EamA-like transporter family protein [Paracidovorax valerianellae]
MTWIALGLLAGLVLGTYDFLTKLALREKTVLEVVMWSSLLGALLWVPFFFVPAPWANTLKPIGLYPASLTAAEQMALLPKSAMMVATWVLSYYSVKSLPLSISAGVRASGPLWTALGAIVFLSEQLNWWQWMGLALSMGSYYLFSLIGRKEGISFQRNMWVLCMLAATLLSSANALYDKHILATLQLDLAAVQAYSAIQRGGIALLLLPWLLETMEWRSLLSRNWAVPAIAATYVLAEFIYLTAVQTDGALISVISVLRRTNLVMVFSLSALFFVERFIRQKILAIAGVLLGIGLTIIH